MININTCGKEAADNLQVNGALNSPVMYLFKDKNPAKFTFSIREK
jgi:hypothetical protein